MINLVLPIGSMHGWGTLGRNVAREMAKQNQVRLFTNPWPPGLAPMEQRLLESIATIVPVQPMQKLKVDGPVLQLVGHDFVRVIVEVSGAPTIACIVFEADSVLPAPLERARQFDQIVVGSSWCAEVLRAAGLTNVFVAVQGVEPLVFNAHQNQKEFFPDTFTVFSGGKFEFRKGQDLVIRAFKVLQERHRDVLLVTSWYNPWPATMSTMQASPLIRLPTTAATFEVVIRELLSMNGIDPTRSLVLGATPNGMMPRIYKDTDVGLFPNRCEGGTNLVMMEYMACGKPVIASFNTGQKDVLSDSHAIPIRKMQPLSATITDQQTTVFEADLDETIEHLEWAYQNRDKLKTIGDAAGEEMKKFSWANTAAVLGAHLK